MPDLLVGFASSLIELAARKAGHKEWLRSVFQGLVAIAIKSAPVVIASHRRSCHAKSWN